MCVTVSILLVLEFALSTFLALYLQLTTVVCTTHDGMVLYMQAIVDTVEKVVQQYLQQKDLA